MQVIAIEIDDVAAELRSTPTLTAYVDASAYRRGGRRGWDAMLDALIERVRSTAQRDLSREERGALERDLRRLELRLRGLPRSKFALSWAVFVANGDVRLCIAMPGHVRTDAHWQIGPWLSPYRRLVSPTRRLPIVATLS